MSDHSCVFTFGFCVCGDESHQLFMYVYCVNYSISEADLVQQVLTFTNVIMFNF